MPGLPIIQDQLANNIYRNAEKNIYSFSSNPRTLFARRFRYRNDLPVENKELCYGNIMYDRRVVRGSTVTQHPPPVITAQSNAARLAEARRRVMARKKAQGQATRNLKLRLGTPPPVEGRKHEDVQTEVFLEELFDYPKEDSVAVQTEPFFDRPGTPLFIPCKVGIDVATQIEPGDLFDFDKEVMPILEVLVGKTIEQALIEVLEEDELASIKEQQRRYKEIRAAEKAEEERLEEEEKRRRIEKEKRIAEHITACNIQQDTEERVAAAVLTTGYIANLLPSVLEGLKEAGYLVDEIKQDVEDNFMTWLMEEVKQEMQRMVENRDLLSEIVKEILETRAALSAGENEDKQPTSEEDFDKNPLPEPDILSGEIAEEETSVKSEKSF
ncbi:radial spoke head protein 3 isoform X2 [Lycorma delicatula]|uniref:radial spoke head protein 3 isoform X2 n=1 Tax=Lycorma delicatula TaxID=130591 RepID=UPI003F50DE0E